MFQNSFYFINFCFFIVIVIPFLSTILIYFLSFNLKKNYLILINFSGIFFSFFFSLLLFIYLLFNSFVIFELDFFYWIKFGNISITFGIFCDKLVILMLFVVSFISCLVHFYSIEYMRYDTNQIKFLQYLTLFTLAMYILIISNNFIQMFIGWEGVGICSYLLINFWDTRLQANTSAMKAIIINRIGDTCLIAAFLLIYKNFNTFNYNNIFLLSNFINLNYFILILLFLGAVGKSAQVFLHIWLPDAMEGPTPVSALIHAATMVTAGIFLIIKCGLLFDYYPLIKKVILIIGSITALFAGSTGILQNDLKKVIAYSTCSQLGFMTIACGLGLYDIALFHLAMHAFFKALLFLSAGSIIHSFQTEEQDIRRMGGLINLMPISYISLFIGSLALMGFPFTAGFYSKDLILEHLMILNCPISFLALICAFLATICTIIYSLRLIYLIFLNKSNVNFNILKNIKESSIFIILPLLILNFFSIFGGYFLKNVFIKYQNWLIEELPFYLKILPFLLIISFSILTFIFLHYFNYFNFIIASKFIRCLHKFLIKKWYFDVIYNFFSRIILSFCFKFLFILGDRGFLELFSSLGITKIFSNLLVKIQNYENTNITVYFFFYISSVFTLIFFICFYFFLV